MDNKSSQKYIAESHGIQAVADSSNRSWWIFTLNGWQLWWNGHWRMAQLINGEYCNHKTIKGEDFRQICKNFVEMATEKENGITAVYATGVDRDVLLGYVGNGFENIGEYFADRAGYGLRTEKIKILDLSDKKIRDYIELKKQKKELEALLVKLEQKIKDAKP